MNRKPSLIKKFVKHYNKNNLLADDPSPVMTYRQLYLLCNKEITLLWIQAFYRDLAKKDLAIVTKRKDKAAYTTQLTSAGVQFLLIMED